MCGIAGFFGTGDQSVLRTMIGELSHRGPDATGLHFDKDIGFAHSRLSIIDLSAAGSQPMFNEDRSVMLLLNGEIYNYRSLKNQLSGRHQFAGNSDTEVLVHLYEEMGEEAFSHLDGMFAIALYDFKKETLFLVRDRFGKKPLYWSKNDESFVFASEIKSLLKHPTVTRELDVCSLNQYLLLEYVPTPNSIFRDIKKLEPATYLKFSNGNLDKVQYWSLAETFNSSPKKLSLKEATDQLDQLLSAAVEKRLMSDVPIGALLSGGLDSSTVTYYMSRLSKQPIDTFSIGFKEASFDESVEARKVANHIGSNHHELQLSAQESCELLIKITDQLDEPLADASIIPTYLLAGFVRESVTVALGGDGADELFMGYDTFEAERYAKLYSKMPPLIRTLAEDAVSLLPTSFNNISLDFKLKKFASGFTESAKYRHANWLGSFDTAARRKLLASEYIETGMVHEQIDNYFNDVVGIEWFNQLSYLYQRTYMMDDILVKVDRASMYHSLEVRTPFLDTKLSSFVNALPKEFKLRGSKKKFLLKKLMEDKLPMDIVYRKKKGFGIPVAYWINNELRELVTDYLSPDRLQAQGIFNSLYVEKLVADHLAQRQDNRKQIWTLLMFQLWYEKWFK